MFHNYWTANAKTVPFTNSKSTLFDGVDEIVTIPFNSALDFSGSMPLTFSFWIKSGLSGTSAVFSNADASLSHRGTVIQLNSNQIDFYQIRTNSGTQLRARSTGTLTANTWTHIGITYSGSGLASGVKFYFNGTAQGTTTINDTMGGLSCVTGLPMIMGRLSAAGQYYAGRLDQVLIYNLELTAAQISALASATVDPPTLDSYANAIVYFKMGDGDTHPTLSDTKSALHATMTNMEAGDFVSDVAT